MSVQEARYNLWGKTALRNIRQLVLVLLSKETLLGFQVP